MPELIVVPNAQEVEFVLASAFDNIKFISRMLGTDKLSQNRARALGLLFTITSGSFLIVGRYQTSN